VKVRLLRSMMKFWVARRVISRFCNGARYIWEHIRLDLEPDKTSAPFSAYATWSWPHIDIRWHLKQEAN